MGESPGLLFAELAEEAEAGTAGERPCQGILS